MSRRSRLTFGNFFRQLIGFRKQSKWSPIEFAMSSHQFIYAHASMLFCTSTQYAQPSTLIQRRMYQHQSWYIRRLYSFVQNRLIIFWNKVSYRTVQQGTRRNEQGLSTLIIITGSSPILRVTAHDTGFIAPYRKKLVLITYLQLESFQGNQIMRYKDTYRWKNKICKN